MDAEPLLPQHLDYLVMRDYAATTLDARRRAIMRINRQIGSSVAAASGGQLVAWQSAWLHGGLSGVYRHTVIVHLTQYLRWVVRAGRRADDPTIALVRPRKVHRSLPSPMSDADVGMALLTAPYPERAWIALAAFCGLRCCEIATLARSNICDGHVPPVLDIIGKGSKQRIVPLPDRVLHELLEAGIPRRGNCWNRADGQPGPPSAMRVSARLNEHLREQGITGTAHKMRHRFGTVLYRETKDPLLVARVMGHENIETVKGYILIDPLEAAVPVAAISRLASEL
jgi:site-specific recombinase XerD